MPMGRFIPVFLAAAIVVPALAHAQATAPVLKEADDDVMVQSFNMSASDLEDADLVDASGNEIGDIETVLVDASGAPVAVAAEVGGFLGMGEKTVVINLDQLQLKDDEVVTVLTKEQLGALTPWGN